MYNIHVRVLGVEYKDKDFTGKEIMLTTWRRFLF